MRKTFFAFIIMLLCLSVAVAQQHGPAVKGKITDPEGNALTGASITVENTILGAQSDAEGNFILQLPRPGNYSIRISFIGYESNYRSAYLDNDTTLNFVLSPKSVMTEEVLVNATRAGQNSPVAFSAVTRKEIENGNTTRDIPYLLDYTPSIVVSSDAGTGVGYTNINVRGSDVKRINVTIDGIPVNDAESHGVWWVDLPDMASSADNIQIQRGVGTSTNGAGAFGATINFQTTDLNKEPYGELNSSYGSFNTSRNTLNFGTGLINKKFAIDGRLSKIWSDGYIDRAFSDLKSFYVSGTLYGTTSMLKLIIFSGMEHTYQAWNGVPKDSLKTNRTYNSYNYKNETDNYWQDNYQLHYSKEINQSLSIDAALHYTYGRGYYENFLQNNDFASFNLPNAVFNSDTITTTDFIAQKWLRNNFYGFTYSINYHNKKLNAIAGGGWNRYSGDHFGDIIWARFVTFDGEKYRWYQGTGDKRDFNTYLKINYSLTPALNLFADLQYRMINYSIGGIDDKLKDVSQEHRYNFFNPKAGITYNFSPQQKVFASFGISQREPDRDNFTDADPGRTPTPEKLFDYEAGYEFRESGFLIKGNLYYMNYADQLILTGKINDVGTTILTNVPKSYRYGIEIETGIQLFENLTWNANIALSRNKIPVYTDYTDNWDTFSQEQEILRNKTISFSPSVVAASVLDFNPFREFHVILNSKYVGKQYIDNTQNTDRMLNGYTVSNLSLLYSFKNKFFKDLTCQFIVNNIFDAKYETNAWVYKYISGGTLLTMDGYFPQAGINYMLRVSMKF